MLLFTTLIQSISPIIILLRGSGWRISDVLYLKIATCLEQDKNSYNLVGDIQKTRILGHKIPITQDVAAVVLTPEDMPALEAYEQQILERVEIGKQAGNAHWTLVNQKNLDERVRPALALLRQGHVVAKADRQEREYTDEEWEQRQQNRKAGNS